MDIAIKNLSHGHSIEKIYLTDIALKETDIALKEFVSRI